MIPSITAIAWCAQQSSKWCWMWSLNRDFSNSFLSPLKWRNVIKKVDLHICLLSRVMLVNLGYGSGKTDDSWTSFKGKRRGWSDCWVDDVFMAQEQGLNSYLQHSCKKTGSSTCICNPRTERKKEAGKFLVLIGQPVRQICRLQVQQEILLSQNMVEKWGKCLC